MVRKGVDAGLIVRAAAHDGRDIQVPADIVAARRQPFRNIAVANSDSEAFAYTHSAINEAYRAVQDLPGS